MTDSPIHNLPQASASFTVAKGTGPVAHNLESALHRASLTSSNHLHPLKEHIGTITKVFNDSFVKKAIRSGGYHEGVARHIKNKIMALDPTIKDNSLKKKVLKQVVDFYKKGSTASKPGVGKDGKVLARYRYRSDETNPNPGHVGSASNLAAGREGESTAAPVSGANFGNKQHYGSITQIAGKKTTPAHGQTGYMMDGDNDILSVKASLKSTKPLKPSTSSASSLNLRSLPIDPKSLGSGLGSSGGFRRAA